MAGRAHGGPQTRGARMFRRHGRRIKKRGAAAGLTPTVPRMEEQKNIRRFGFISRNNTVCIYINRTILCAGPEGGRLRRTEFAAHGGPQAGRELVLQAVRVCGQAKNPAKPAETIEPGVCRNTTDTRAFRSCSPSSVWACASYGTLGYAALQWLWFYKTAAIGRGTAPPSRPQAGIPVRRFAPYGRCGFHKSGRSRASCHRW